MNESTTVSLFTSIEEVIRVHVRDFIEQVIEDELSTQLERSRYERGGAGYRNGHRDRTLVTTHGEIQVSVPRARLQTPEGEQEFHSSLLRKGKRLTSNAEALIVACYLCGVSTRKVELALCQALGAGTSKSTVSRCLQTLRPDWETWQVRDLSKDAILRVILDGFCIHARMGSE